MVDKFYPEAPQSPADPVVIDKVAEGREIIRFMQEGMSEEIAKRFRAPEDRERDPKPGEPVAGDPMTKTAIISAVLAGRDCFHDISSIYDEVINEKRALAKVQIKYFDKESDYKSALGDVAVYGDVDTYYAGVKVHEKCPTWSALKEKYPTPVPPAKVTGLNVDAVSDAGVLLSWDDVDGATSYRVRRDGSIIAKVGTSEFNDTGLEPETEYTYQVSAVGEGGEGPLSAEVKATTGEAPVEPETVPKEL